MILSKGKTRDYRSAVATRCVARQSWLVHDCTFGVMSKGSDNERGEGHLMLDRECTSDRWSGQVRCLHLVCSIGRWPWLAAASGLKWLARES